MMDIPQSDLPVLTDDQLQALAMWLLEREAGYSYYQHGYSAQARAELERRRAWADSRLRSLGGIEAIPGFIGATQETAQ